MEPYQAMMFDNRPRVAQFIDGSPMTDGMANFGAALINAGPAAAQIRRQREAEAMDQLWRQRQYDRQTQQDELARLWHEQTAQRQEKQDALAARVAQANIDNMNADNARQNLGMFGTGVNNAAARGIDLLKLLFRGGGAKSPGRGPQIHWIEGEDGGKKPFIMGEDGQLHPVPIAVPPAPPAPPTEDEIRANNVRETGYPDREYNWYNPADWFRSPPKAPAPGADGSMEDMPPQGDEPAAPIAAPNNSIPSFPIPSVSPFGGMGTPPYIPTGAATRFPDPPAVDARNQAPSESVLPSAANAWGMVMNAANMMQNRGKEPAASKLPREGTVIKNPKTGQRFRLEGGKWVEIK